MKPSIAELNKIKLRDKNIVTLSWHLDVMPNHVVSQTCSITTVKLKTFPQI